MKNTIVKRLFKTYVISLFIFVTFVLGSMLVPAQPLYAAGNNYYVAKNGSDGNTGTLVQPWLTLQHAADAMTAGDTVYVRGGTYNEQLVLDIDGTDGNRITFINYPGETPIIDGEDVPGVYDDIYDGIVRITASYTTFQGFEVKNNAAGFGVMVYRSSAGANVDSVTVKACKIHDTYKSGIYSTSSYSGSGVPLTGLVLDGNEIYLVNQGGGETEENISCLHTDGAEIKNNYLHDNLQEGIDFKNGNNGGLIHDNLIEDSSCAIYIAGYGDDEQTNMKIYNNILRDGVYGIVFGNEHGDTLQQGDVYNNIIYNNSVGFAVWGSYTFYLDVRIVNNTFYNNTTAQASIVNPTAYNVECVVRNNIFVGADSNVGLLTYSDSGDGSSITVDHNLFYSLDHSYYYSNDYGTDYVYDEDPILLNPLADFSLASDSPAIDSGSSSLAPDFDLLGTSRPRGGAYDIGAYEYDSGAPANTPPIALDDIYSTDMNVILTIPVPGVLNNDIDADGDILTAAKLSNPVHGTVTLNANGSFTYTPAVDFSGTDSFTYSANDLQAGSDIGMVTISINAVNRSPVLNNPGNKSVNEAAALIFTVSATDPDADMLTYSASQLPAGAVFTPATRTFSWTPTDSQAGTYPGVSFRVSDGDLSDTETITITVINVSPPAVDEDINGDTLVNILDVIIIFQHFGQIGAPGWIQADVNNDGTVNILDINLVVQHWTG